MSWFPALVHVTECGSIAVQPLPGVSAAPASEIVKCAPSVVAAEIRLASPAAAVTMICDGKFSIVVAARAAGGTTSRQADTTTGIHARDPIARQDHRPDLRRQYEKEILTRRWGGRRERSRRSGRRRGASPPTRSRRHPRRPGG